MATKNSVGAAQRPKGATDAIDPVAESSEESFPASDSPAWTTSGEGRPSLKKKKRRKKNVL